MTTEDPFESQTEQTDFSERITTPCMCSCGCLQRVPYPAFKAFVSKMRCHNCSQPSHIKTYPLKKNNTNTVLNNSSKITKIVELNPQEAEIARNARGEIQKELWQTAWERWQNSLPEKFKQASINNENIKERLNKLVEGRSSLDISGALIQGLVGRGKTWLAIGYANDAIKAGILHPSEVIFGTESELLASASNSKFGEVETKLGKLTSGKYKCIIIDDIGRGTWLRDDMRPKVFSLVFDKQWAHGNMVVITTNLSRDELGKYIGAAAMERLLAMCGYAPDILVKGADKRRERTSIAVQQHKDNSNIRKKAVRSKSKEKTINESIEKNDIDPFS